MFATRTTWRLTPNRLSRLLDEFRQQGRAYIDLTESNPTRCGFSYDADAILKSLADPRALLYEPDPRGLRQAREAVVGYYAESGLHLTAEQVFLTTSTSEAYSYLFRLLADSGDSVLVPHPSYPLFEFLAALSDLRLVPYPLVYGDGWAIDLAAVRASVVQSDGRARGIVVVHPNNPTGSYVSQTELNGLIEISSQHSLALIADEVFRDYAFAPQVGRVITHAAETRVLTFTLSGLSKIAALPQMKLAWMVVNGPREMLAGALERLEIVADTYLSVSAPLAHALPSLLDMRRAIQPQILERIRSNLHRLDEQITSDSPVSRLRAEGGWYAVLKVPATRPDEDWAVELLSEDAVLVHPGHFYDFSSEGHLVISLLPPAEMFREGIRRLLARFAGQTLDDGRPL
jgi:aspartate/methionine/tyrosine aminotransferase